VYRNNLVGGVGLSGLFPRESPLFCYLSMQLFAINYLSDKAFTPSAADVAENEGNTHAFRLMDSLTLTHRFGSYGKMWLMSSKIGKKPRFFYVVFAEQESEAPLLYNIHDVPSKKQLFTPEYMYAEASEPAIDGLA
jgi:hypothetical protein